MDSQNSITGSLLVEHAKLTIHMEKWDKLLNNPDSTVKNASTDVYYKGMAELLTKPQYETQVLIPESDGIAVSNETRCAIKAKS